MADLLLFLIARLLAPSPRRVQRACCGVVYTGFSDFWCIRTGSPQRAQLEARVREACWGSGPHRSASQDPVEKGAQRTWMGLTEGHFIRNIHLQIKYINAFWRVSLNTKIWIFISSQIFFPFLSFTLKVKSGGHGLINSMALKFSQITHGSQIYFENK